MVMNVRRVIELDAFQGLSPHEAEEVFDKSKIISIDKDIVVVEKNQKLGSVLGVLKGRIVVGHKPSVGAKIALASFASGSTLGWYSLLDGSCQRLSIWAEKDTQLLVISEDKALDFVFRFSSLNRFVIKKLVETIRKQQEATNTLSMPGAHQRIFMYILHLARQEGGFKSELVLPKQTEIALNVNASRETVSRALGLLMNQGAVTKEGHRLKIIKVATLQRLAHATDKKSESAILGKIRETI